MITIDIQDSAHYEQKITIDGVVFLFRFDFYPRTSAWYLSMRDNESALLVSGRKLVRGWNPLLRDKNTSLPRGAFYLYSTSEDVGRDAFIQESAALVYFSEAEAEELGAFAGSGDDLIVEAAS